MIQEIFPHKFDNIYIENAIPSPDDYVICYRNGMVSAIDMEGNLSLTKVSDFGDENFSYLFTFDDIKVFGLYNTEVLPAGAQYLPSRTPLNVRPSHIGYILLCAFHIMKWYDETKYCPHCGKVLAHHSNERRMICPDCGTTQYPRINPCIIIAVLNGEKILLTQYAHRAYKHYALVAGFTEFGETIEETCHREVLEETGVRIKNLKYYKSQPWAMSQSLLFGFYAELDGEDSITLDTNELAVGEWHSVYDIDESIPANTLTQELMQQAKHNLYK